MISTNGAHQWTIYALPNYLYFSSYKCRMKYIYRTISKTSLIDIPSAVSSRWNLLEMTRQCYAGRWGCRIALISDHSAFPISLSFSSFSFSILIKYRNPLFLYCVVSANIILFLSGETKLEKNENQTIV